MTTHAWLHILFEPQVQHIMQEHVRKEGRNHSALRRASVGVTHAPVFRHASDQPSVGARPFVDQAQQHTVTHPTSEKIPQVAMIQIVERHHILMPPSRTRKNLVMTG